MVKEMTLEDRVDGINEVLKGMGADFKAEYTVVAKNNCTKQGLMLKSEDYNCAPTIYPDERMLGMSDTDIAEGLNRLFENHARNVDMGDVISREHILETVLPKLVSANNKSSLDDRRVVYKEFLDMLISFYIPVEEMTDCSFASIQLTYPLIQSAGIDLDELFEAAMKNNDKDVEICGMAELLSKMMGIPMDDMDMPMTVVSSGSRINGAAKMLSSIVLETLTEKLGDGFRIIPSSINEFIAVPAWAVTDMALVEMVKQVNETQVSEEERLTNNAYICRGGVISAII